MIAAVTLLLSPAVRPWIMTGLAIIACVAVYRWGYNHHRQVAHVEQIERQLEQRETRDEVEAVVAREPRPVDQLLDRWSRD